MPFTGLFVRNEGDEWWFSPPNAWDALYNDLHEIAADLDNHKPNRKQLQKHQKLLTSVLAIYPDLIQAYSLRSEIALRLGDLNAAVVDAQAGVEACLNCFPEWQIPKKAKIYYYVVENRPFFRVFWKRAYLYQQQPYASPFERQDNLKNAFALSKMLLDVNPGDNVGARSIAFDCAMELGDYQTIWKYTSGDWSDTTCPDILYGRSLAGFVLRKRTVDKVLETAIYNRPLVAKALLHNEIANPFKENTLITSGGADEALIYRDNHHTQWAKAEGALEWLGEKAPLIEEAEAYWRRLWLKDSGDRHQEDNPYPAIYSLPG